MTSDRHLYISETVLVESALLVHQNFQAFMHRLHNVSVSQSNWTLCCLPNCDYNICHK